MIAQAVETFTATEVQNRLVDTVTDGRYRIIGFGGGIRGTKTFGALSVIITLAKIFPRSRWAIVRKDLERLRKNTLPSFNKLRELTGGFVGEMNGTTWEAKCENGSVILFFGENIDKDPELDRWKGLEVNGFVLEEADELAERSFIKAIERAGAWIVPNGEQPSPLIICTFNPCANWPKRRFYLPWRDGTLEAPYAFIPTTAADNPFVSDEQREAWKEMPEHEYKRFVEGDWESITGAYYDTLDASTHLIDRQKLPRVLPDHWRYWGSFDWGYRHWAVFGFWATDTDGTDYLLNSVWLRQLQDDELAQEYQKEVHNPDNPDAKVMQKCLRLVYAGHDCWNKSTAHGASGESTFEIFAKAGIILTKADIDLVDSGRAVNRQLKVHVTKREDGTEVRRTGVYIVKTTGNLKVFDQLGEIMPDENDIRKPDKSSGRFDADINGQGGDDGADMFRYGIATRVSAAKPAEAPPIPEDRSPGFDWKKQRPAQRPSADQEMSKLFERARTNLTANRYRIPRR